VAKRDLTGHQRKIVDRYYEHRDTIMVHKLGEIVSELALAESDKARDRLWARAEKALANLATNEARVRKVLADRSVEGLARLVGELSGR
jgi:hypothetical protein